MSLIKSSQEIEVLKKGGKILARILLEVMKKVAPGVSTWELDKLAEKLIIEAGGKPSFKNYGQPPFPNTMCLSINSELVHGIAHQKKILKNGDILSLDIGMRYPAKDGLYTDMARTIAVGEVSKNAKKLIQVTKDSLAIVKEELRPGIDLQEIAAKIQNFVQDNGFSVIRALVGHGVGHQVHEEPQIPNFVIKDFHFIVKPGMVLAFEPMVSAGSYHVITKEDNWTVQTKDNSLTAHFEDTFAVTEKGNLVITE